MKATNWFIIRGLKVLKYQSEVLAKIKTSMSKQEVTILAACPSAGKTIMAIYCIEDYLNSHPNAKVLVLTHGTTILRTQFHDVLEEVKPGYSYNLVEKFTEFDYNKQVNVCLPQTINGNILSHINLLVVDEAHQFYFADMVQEIIKRINPQKQLLLTGTPSVFIQRGFSIIPIPLLTIYDEGMTADVRVEIATSSYNFDIIRDYNEDKELKSEIEIQENETTKTLDELLSKIIAKLNNNRSIRTWSQTLAQLKKTMFACKSQQQATQIKKYFDAIGIKSALSISDIDTDSAEIERFKAEVDCLILIVVGRGILGFNYTRLVNIVDMSTSQNIDRIYQLFCRVVRKHPDGDKKLFFKIAPKDKSDYYKYIMTGVLALSSEEFFCKFNGKNFDELKIPVKENNSTYDYKTTKGKSKPNKSTKAKIYEPIDFSNFPVLEFFKDVYENDKTLSTYTLTDIKDVRAEFLSRKPSDYWTLDKCKVSARKYGLLEEWKANEYEAYNASKINGWYVECLKEMTNTLDERLKNRCIEVAQKYSTIRRWRRKDKNTYQLAVKYGWLNLCTQHMLVRI
jgi:superfamily II DNA or RNA helicase